MANPEHIAWLLEGVESWNKRYNKTQPGGYPFTPNLEGADLYSAFRDAGKLNQDGRIPLAGADLSEAILTRAILDFADLTKANLNSADLTEASLKFAILAEATLRDAKLTKTTFDYANLTRANLTAAEPWKADLYPQLGISPKQYPDEAEPFEAIVDLLPMIQKIANYYGATAKLYFRGEGRLRLGLATFFDEECPGRLV